MSCAKKDSQTDEEVIGLRSVVKSSDIFPWKGSSFVVWGDGRWLGKRVAIESGNSKTGGVSDSGSDSQMDFLIFCYSGTHSGPRGSR